jgi:hypothetical protein
MKRITNSISWSTQEYAYESPVEVEAVGAHAVLLNFLLWKSLFMSFVLLKSLFMSFVLLKSLFMSFVLFIIFLIVLSGTFDLEHIFGKSPILTLMMEA